jgi:hypothetical protein
MLVKCISFIITIFGSKRYKPVLLTLASGIIALSGIGVVAALNDTHRDTAASTTQSIDNNTRETLESQTPSKQSTREEEPVPTNPNNGSGVAESSTVPAIPNNNTPKPETPAQNTPPTLVGIPESGQIAISENETQSLVVHTSDASKVYWAITVGTNCDAYQITPKQSTEATNAISFTLSNSATVRGTPCSVTITAKDVTGVINLSANLTLAPR